MFSHPIFTSAGLFYFLTELTRTYWRGEFVWRWQRIASPIMDSFYIISSALFLAALLFGRARTNRPFRFALAAGLFVVVVSVLFLAFMSMRYDFGRCFYPSRDNPFFVSGRLISGTILPFLLLYIEGLHRILSWMRLPRALLSVVVVIVVAITASEILISLPAFVSPYNFFHLW